MGSGSEKRGVLCRTCDEDLEGSLYFMVLLFLLISTYYLSLCSDPLQAEPSRNCVQPKKDSNDTKIR